MQLPREIIETVISVYDGDVMRLLLVSKWVNKAAREYLVNEFTVTAELDLIHDYHRDLARAAKKLYVEMPWIPWRSIDANPIKLYLHDNAHITGSFTHMTRLKRISLPAAHQNISNLSQLTSLEELKFTTPGILDVSMYTTLKHLSVHGDQDKSSVIYIGGLNLISLDISHGIAHGECDTLLDLKLDRASIKKLTQPLRSLDVTYVRDINDYKLMTRSLSTLHLWHVPDTYGFFDIAIGNHLRELMLYGTNVVDEDLAYLTALTKLDVRECMYVTGSCLQAMSSLTSLVVFLRKNREDISIVHLTALTHLTLQSNTVNDDMISPLTSLKTLQIYAHGNNMVAPITDRGLAPLTQLEFLQLSLNKSITDFGISHLIHMKTVDISGSSLTPKCGKGIRRYKYIYHGDRGKKIKVS